VEYSTWRSIYPVPVPPHKYINPSPIPCPRTAISKILFSLANQFLWLLKLFMSLMFLILTTSLRMPLFLSTQLVSPKVNCQKESFFDWFLDFLDVSFGFFLQELNWIERLRSRHQSFWCLGIEGMEWISCNQQIVGWKLLKRTPLCLLIVLLNTPLISSNSMFRYNYLHLFSSYFVLRRETCFCACWEFLLFVVVFFLFLENNGI